MRKRTSRLWAIAAVGFLLAGGIYALSGPRHVTIEAPKAAGRLPRIFPEYSGTVIPPNIAPLNFAVKEPGKLYCVKIHSRKGDAIEVVSENAKIIIPQKPWKRLLEANRGEDICADVFVKADDGWRQFDTITNRIAQDEIDCGLVYRLIRPLFNIYRTVGVYQRDLESYDETPVLRNDTYDRGCLNCHTFLNHNPETMAIHIRSRSAGKPMLLAREGDVTTVQRPGGYLSWHPSGRQLAFSTNKLSLFFHTMGEAREVFDAASDIKIYRIDENKVVSPPSLSDPEQMETWPCWAPDGKHLYFCSTHKQSIQDFTRIRYSLMRVAYDPDNDTWGEPETVLSADETKLSIAQPRVSPDGRFLLFCMSAFGNFPVYRKSSDLYLMDLETRKYRRLEINSDECESWHSWSSNGRWIVFSSKRRDGLFARPHFSYVDGDGIVYPPFVLPQKDPTFYDTFIRTYNVPELVCGNVAVSQRELARAVVNPRHPVKPTSDDPPQEHRDETQAPDGEPTLYRQAVQ